MPPRFIADVNVGKLAKWLRIAGYDVLLLKDASDTNLVNVALRQKRILLTRDRAILNRRVVANGSLNVVLVESESPAEQLRQVMTTLDPTTQPPTLSRCIRCNESLVEKSREEIAGLVPPFVLRTQECYMQCPACSRIYWRGTHWERMKRRLEELRTASH
ncbi:MAG: Mut7-C RNAse domain-containing protein [Chloroflexota bacterium]